MPETAVTAPPHLDIEPLCAWLSEAAVLGMPLEDLLRGTGERAVALGLPLLRAAVSPTMLHPQFESVSLAWRRDTGLAAGERHGHGARTEARFVGSPLKRVLDEAIATMTPLLAGGGRPAELLHLNRYRIEQGEGVGQFPILAELHAGGGTDYVCCALPFGSDGRLDDWPQRGVLTSWATDRPGGFREADMAALTRIQLPFAAAVRAAVTDLVTRTVMRAYVGSDAGMRVLRGEIRRGTAQSLHAAILFADLRGFTRLSDSLPHAETVAVLNRYLEAMAVPIERHGGQVLKFLGDGLLATFATAGDFGDFGGPGESGEAVACGRAAAAARAAHAAVGALNRDRAGAGLPVMALDVALHIGDVMYGNVGCETRLDFTVIGPAVNEASRMEALCEPLGCAVVASAAFVGGLGGEASAAGFRPLGRHTLRGLAEPRDMYGLANPE